MNLFECSTLDNGELIEDSSKVRELLQHNWSRYVVVDVETTSAARDAKLVGVGLFDPASDSAWYILPHANPPALIELLNKLARENIWIAHNAAFDIGVLRRFGLREMPRVIDTMVLAHVTSGGVGSLRLSDLTGTTSWSELDVHYMTSEEMAKYNIDQLRATYALAEDLIGKAWANFMLDLLERIDFPLVNVIVHMEEMGMPLDLDRLAELRSELEAARDAMYDALCKELGVDINSPKQLGEYFYKRKGIEPPKFTKTGKPSTNREALEELAKRGVKEAERILEYRRIAKLASTYAEGLSEHIESDGCIHPRFHQCGTVSGRLSSSEPNCQNIVVDERFNFRRCFVAPDGYFLVVADYSQIELRVLAALSRDKNLMDDLLSGDVHSATAKAIFGTTDKRHRSVAKTINFGVAYGMTPAALARRLDISVKQAASFIKAWYGRYRSIERFRAAVLKFLRDHGYVELMTGRRRKFEEYLVGQLTEGQRHAIERQAFNFLIQGTAAELMRLALVKLWEAGIDVRMTIHDEAVVMAPAKEAAEIATEVEYIMTHLDELDLQFPIKVDVKVVRSWGDAK